MGYDNTGILFYGIFLHDDAKLPWEDPDSPYESWEEYFLEKSGFVDPRPVYEGDRMDREAESAWYHTTYKPWREKRDAAIAAAGCNIGIYNSCHNPWRYIAYNDAHFEGGCCPPLELDPDAMQVTPLADETLRAFCEVMGIPFEQPKWYLTGLYS